MANIQTQLLAFHDAIKLDDENSVLQEKRDILKKELEDNLPDGAPEIDRYILQGSYAIYTGINPPDGDYDIDVGVVFNADEDQCPKALKKMVRDALNMRENRTVKYRRPCITVEYKSGDSNLYHVDLPVYIQNDFGELELAWGKEFSDHEFRLSDPEGLVRRFNSVNSSKEARAQFRRCVKYLKAWRNHCFKHLGNGAPVSIGLTIMAHDAFDYTTNYSGEDDMGALRAITSQMLTQFSTGLFGGEWEVEAEVPTQPYDNVFERMTSLQIENFYNKLDALDSALKDAEDEEQPEEACKLLSKHFGPDFPIPSIEDTASKAAFYATPSGRMA